MLWKIQSGIAPPFFYVVIAEKDKLKTLKDSVRDKLKTLRVFPKIKNTVDPNVQSHQMYPVA